MTKPKDTTSYSIEQALEKVISSSKEKFDATVEVHCNFKLEVKKPDQSFRTTVSLPHGTGRQLRVATFSTEKVDNADMQLTDSDLDKIVAGSIAPKRDFDILVSEPSLMPKLAKVARVLGPAGVMPNPKNGTVAADVKNAVEQIKKGKIEIRTEQNFPIMHSILGKKSFGVKKLTENFEELWTTLKASKPAKAKPDWIKDCYITSSMGQSYQVDITTL